MKKIILVSILLILSSCASWLDLAIYDSVRTKYIYSPNAQYEIPPKEVGCDFKAQRSELLSGYTEIGVFDIFYEGRQPIPESLPHFKEMVAVDACKAGADVVVGVMNGNGKYINGIAYIKNK